jgi:uncharacterized protein YigE (DUF2233 family)
LVLLNRKSAKNIKRTGSREKVRQILLFLLLLSASLEALPKGVRYEHRTFDGPLSFHILEVDPEKIIIKAATAGDTLLTLATTSAIAQREGAFAAVNGGFFRHDDVYNGLPSSILKISGQWLSSANKSRAAIGWKDEGKTALIDRLAMRSLLAVGNDALQIDGINQVPGRFVRTLYTWRFGKQTPTEGDIIEYSVNQDRILSSISKGGHAAISPGGYVYSLKTTSDHLRDDVYIGEQAELFCTVIPLVGRRNIRLWNEMENIVGGTPLLVYRGSVTRNYSPEQTLRTFLENKFPRTAVGLKKNGNWVFVVVEGRDPQISVGLTMVELGELMLSLGCEYALNLDGGGSSTLYLEGRVVNALSGDDEGVDKGVERAVGNAILLFERE